MSKPHAPNIILINCDDLGYGDLGCYGSSVNNTPALDRLASEGMRFTDFSMASSICTPSRAGMLTGCYPQRLSMNRVLFPGDAEGLHPQEETIAAMLKRAGYATALVGKWHLGDQPEFLPCRFGFDHYYGLPYSNDMGRQTGDVPEKAPLPLMLDDEVIEEQPDQAGLTERYVEESVRFLRDRAAAGQPFFLYFAHVHVHLPIYTPERFMQESKNGRYGAAVAQIDWAWDRLDYELKRLGIAEDTIVLFTSDNGSRAGGEGGSNGPFRGAKFTTWEGGFRLPLLARWPGHIPAGSTCEGMAASMDLLPTIARWAGVKPQTERPMDGVDLGDMIAGSASASPREVFAYFSRGNLCAIRKGRWKLHFCTKGEWGQPFPDCEELYDLDADPGESNNLHGEHPGVVKELTALAETWRRELGDAFTGTTGTSVRDCGRVEHPKTLTNYNPEHPYIIAEYDLADRG